MSLIISTVLYGWFLLVYFYSQVCQIGYILYKIIRTYIISNINREMVLWRKRNLSMNCISSFNSLTNVLFFFSLNGKKMSNNLSIIYYFIFTHSLSSTLFFSSSGDSAMMLVQVRFSTYSLMKNLWSNQRNFYSPCLISNSLLKLNLLKKWIQIIILR